MPFTVTLIANPDHAPLLPAHVSAVMQAVEAASLRWLADDTACALHCENGTVSWLETKARAALAGLPIDVVVQGGTDHALRKSILIADMDSTMIQQECIDELAAEAGLKEQVSAITARAMNGELDFEEALRDRVALLKGLPSAVIDTVLANRISLMPGATELVATMRRDGAYCALVSGGFTDFTARIAGLLGFQEHRANQLLHDGDVLSGAVASPILGRDAKVAALDEIAARVGVGVDDAIAVGDGANDLGMLARAGVGVALHAKPVVAEQAQIRVDHGDLTALLYIQGYCRDEFAT